VRDGDPAVTPTVETALPQPTATVRVDLTFGEQTSDQRVVFTCTVPIVGDRAEAKVVVVDRINYLPREVFFGRFGFAGVFLSVCRSGFSRFFPATSSSFPSRSWQGSCAAA
jgi:hypothetical protein